MRPRRISTEQAKAAYAILVRYGGAPDNEGDEHSFIFHVSHPETPCDEYRFMGHLGFGGKFRNNGNRDSMPYVDCYPENRTVARDAVVLSVNAMLGELFGEKAP